MSIQILPEKIFADKIEISEKSPQVQIQSYWWIIDGQRRLHFVAVAGGPFCSLLRLVGPGLVGGAVAGDGTLGVARRGAPDGVCRCAAASEAANELGLHHKVSW